MSLRKLLKNTFLLLVNNKLAADLKRLRQQLLILIVY